MGLFTALPVVLHIGSCPRTCSFQSIGSQRLVRDGLPKPSPNHPFDARLQNITFGTFQCCLGFATHTDCQPLPVYLTALNVPLGSATRIKDVYALKGIASGITHTSLAWAIVSTVMLVVTVAAIFSSQRFTFMQRLRPYGMLLKFFVVFWSIAIYSFLMLLIIFMRQASWDLRDVVGDVSIFSESIIIEQNRYTISASTNHPPPYHTNRTTKPSTEWLLPASPVSTWPSPPSTTSSISTSSHEAYAPPNDESCSSFDNSFNATQWSTLASSAVNTFGHATVQFPPSAVPPTWDNSWMPEADSQGRLYPSIPLFTIHDELTIDEEHEDTETLLQPSRVPTPWPNVTLTALTVRSQHKAASNGSKRSRRSSRNSKSMTTCAVKHPSRAETSDKDRRRLSASRQRSSTSRQLRTSKPSYPPNRTTFPSASTDTSKGNNKTSHNLVEKQYRTRLNGLFAAILSAIPEDVIAADLNGYTRGDGSPGKVVSKGAVLALARRHIEALEKREMSFEGKKETLIEKIQWLDRVLATLGVDIM
ncbi:hypothetical protein IFR05_004379, partial [Cadophora sp. M221]